MPGELKKKAKERELTGERKPIQIIIGDPLPSTSSFVEEQIIELDPKIERGGDETQKPVVIRSRTKPEKKKADTSRSRYNRPTQRR